MLSLYMDGWGGDETWVGRGYYVAMGGNVAPWFLTILEATITKVNRQNPRQNQKKGFVY